MESDGSAQLARDEGRWTDRTLSWLACSLEEECASFFLCLRFQRLVRLDILPYSTTASQECRRCLSLLPCCCSPPVRSLQLYFTHRIAEIGKPPHLSFVEWVPKVH